MGIFYDVFVGLFCAAELALGVFWFINTAPRLNSTPNAPAKPLEVRHSGGRVFRTGRTRSRNNRPALSTEELNELIRQRRDEEFPGPRYKIPVAIGGLFLIGLIVWYIFTLFDTKSNPSFFYVFQVSLSIIGLTILFSIKNFFAPIFIMGALSWTTYNLLQYGIIDFFPIYEFIFAYLLWWAPKWVQYGYMIISVIFLIGVAISSPLRRAAIAAGKSPRVGML